MKNSSKHKQNMGIYKRKQGQNKVNSCHAWALDTKRGWPFSWTRVQYVAQYFSPFALQCVENRSS